jgi:hypothetical protein
MHTKRPGMIYDNPGSYHEGAHSSDGKDGTPCQHRCPLAATWGIPIVLEASNLIVASARDLGAVS